MQDWISFIKLDLLISIPQCLTITWVTFALLGLRPSRRWRRIGVLAIVNSVYTDLFIRILPTPVHILNSIAVTTVLLLFLFKDIPLKKRLLALLLSYVVGIVSDLSTLKLYACMHDSGSREHILDNAGAYVSALYPTLVVLGIVSIAVEARSARWFDSLRQAGGFIRSNRLVEVLVCLLIQLLAGCTVVTARILPDEYARYAFFDYIFFGTVLMTVPTLYFVVRLIDRTRRQAVLATQEHYIEQISSMFTLIRGQRHDYLNHIQVMYTMLQLGKHAELKAYMAEVVRETHEVGDVVQHEVPAVAALLKTKTAAALSRGIDFSSEFSGSWNSESPVKVIDIVKIAGNLIDNAFDEVMKLPAGERHVRAAFCSGDGYLELMVSNPGPPIDAAARARLFEPGYTTKPGKDRGLGLPIVRERVDYYNGTLTVRSDEHSGTVFHIRLPLRAAQMP